jgi:hypothetical protein
MSNRTIRSCRLPYLVGFGSGFRDQPSLPCAVVLHLLYCFAIPGGATVATRGGASKSVAAAFLLNGFDRRTDLAFGENPLLVR